MLDALRGYLQLANGLTDVTRQRALSAARQLIDQGGEVLGDAVSSTMSGKGVGGGVTRQVSSLAEDLLATSRTNRDLLLGIVRTEIDRAVAAMGLVNAEDLEAMARKVERLERQLDAAVAFGGAEAAPARKSPAKKAPAKKVAAKKVAAKKVAVKRVPVKPAEPVAAPGAPSE
ncbi:MAG TPA: polyhydroxyalkanoate synthesis protein PhaF [Actinomycetes bacterium]